MTINKENIDKVIKQIKAADADRFRMSCFLSDSGHLCGTAACIAGWTALTFHKQNLQRFVNIDFHDQAAYHLGLDRKQCEELFYMSYDEALDVEVAISQILDDLKPYASLDSFDRVLPPNVRQAAAVNVLTILRDTEKVDWLTAIKQAKAAHA